MYLEVLSIEPEWALHQINSCQMWCQVGQPPLHILQTAVGQSLSKHLTERTNDLPVLPSISNPRHSCLQVMAGSKNSSKGGHCFQQIRLQRLGQGLKL